MSDEKRCPECGSMISGTGPVGGLCPRCLMKQGLDGGGPTASGGGGRSFEPPAPEEIAGHFPQYEILELIGRGGMGAVYKARQPELDRLVALKILAPDRIQDPAFAERFTREARTLARLSHPHIVGIHEFGESDGLYYFIMEYVDGAGLREILQTGRLSPVEALELVPQICSALQFAHEAGVVHRDVKPENILLDRSGNVKIADFGLAKMLEPGVKENVTLTVSGAVMGTPAYMAPEQIEHPLDVDHRADIFAVGVVFYEMLTGELPLGRFDPPSSMVSVDVRLDSVVLRALEKERTRRYQLARDVTADLEKLDGIEPVPDTPEATGVRSVKITRPPAVSWLAAYSFLGAGAWIIVMFLPVLGLFSGAPFLGLRSGDVVLEPQTRAVLSDFAPLALISLASVSIGFVLAIWHCITGFGILGLRNWGRYNLIILAVLELPGSLLPLISFVFLPLLPATILSILVLVYLFRPAVARIFELGLGSVTLTDREAEAVERVLGSRIRA